MLNFRFWIMLVVTLISTIVSICIGGYFWIGGIGILIFMGLIFWDTIDGWGDRPMSTLQEMALMTTVTFSFASLHVSAFMGCYPSLALALFVWASIIVGIYAERKRARQWNAWREQRPPGWGEPWNPRPWGQREKREKVDWLHEGF